MSVPRRDQREQEVSIRQREGELFRREDEAASTAKPFAEYLRETPAAPLPAWLTAALWAIGVVVVLLLAAAFWRLQSRPAPHALRKGRPKHSRNFEPARSPSFQLSDAGASRRNPTNLETP